MVDGVHLPAERKLSNPTVVVAQTSSTLLSPFREDTQVSALLPRSCIA